MFSDGVFAVLITVLVLELRPPEQPTFAALLALWPAWLSYAVSYLFIAIVWANHHYLMRYANEATPRLLWSNFAHLFSMSLLPFSTAWMAGSELAPQPVAFYAAVFFLVNTTYIFLIWELIGSVDKVSSRVRRIMRFRSIATLCLFGLAAVVALEYPLVGLGICIACLVVYLKPDPRERGVKYLTRLRDEWFNDQQDLSDFVALLPPSRAHQSLRQLGGTVAPLISHLHGRCCWLQEGRRIYLTSAAPAFLQRGNGGSEPLS